CRRRGADGALSCRLSRGLYRLSFCGRGHRGGARLLGCLFRDSVLYRHARRHAGLQGPCTRAAAGPVGRAVPADLPEIVLGLYAVGGNAKAAKLSGIKTERLTFLTFVNMGVLAALAGLVFAARLNTATPKAGAGFELDVIAACFIGGASAYGGVGLVGGAVVGAMIMGVMNNGMS